VSAAASASKTVDDGLIAAPGRVEAISEEVRVSSELSGRLKSVNVEEGDRVKRGRVLANLKMRIIARASPVPKPSWHSAKRNCRRTMNGSRTEERREADAAKQAGKAVLENAKSEAERRRGLAGRGVISRDEADRLRARISRRASEYEQHRSTLRLWTHKPAKKIALKRKPTFPKREPNSRKRGPFLRRVFCVRRWTA